MNIYHINGTLLYESKEATQRDAVVEAVLSRAVLSRAYLRGADLRGADLRGADLHGADLHGADLCGADLSRAYLRGADLCGAYLHGADLHGADLIDAGQDSRGYQFVAVQHDDGPRIKAGCRWFTLAEAREHWGSPTYHEGEAIGAECLARVELIASLAALRGWPVVVPVGASNG